MHLHGCGIVGLCLSFFFIGSSARKIEGKIGRKIERKREQNFVLGSAVQSACASSRSFRRSRLTKKGRDGLCFARSKLKDIVFRLSVDDHTKIHTISRTWSIRTIAQTGCFPPCQHAHCFPSLTISFDSASISSFDISTNINQPRCSLSRPFFWPWL